jgi:thiol:disulfide interchange protein
MKYLFILVFGLLVLPVQADGPAGIQFFQGSWQQVLAEAQLQNRPIFVDIYTNWCPPCRRMAREAFPNPKVGEKFNTYFISYQVNAEYGEGLNVAKSYGVQSYPTSLFITPTGELVHRAVGYGGVESMITQADHALHLPKLRQFRKLKNRKQAAD